MPKKKSVANDDIGPEEEVVNNEKVKIMCSVCNLQVSKQSIWKHRKSSRHMAKLREAETSVTNEKYEALQKELEQMREEKDKQISILEAEIEELKNTIKVKNERILQFF